MYIVQECSTIPQNQYIYQYVSPQLPILYSYTCSIANQSSSLVIYPDEKHERMHRSCDLCCLFVGIQAMPVVKS